MLCYQNISNYTDQMHNIHYIHLLCFYYMFWRYLYHQGELCVLYVKPHAVTQLLYMVTTLVTL